MKKEEIIREIKRTAEENDGVPLGVERFRQATGITKSDWYAKHWVRWGDALTEAGYSPNQLRGAYSDEFVLKKLVSFIQEIGRYPVMGELRLKAKQEPIFPSHSVFSRVGKKAELAKKVIEFCQERDGLEDVIKICEPIALQEPLIKQPPENDSEAFGFVYLMKSGRFYKIGRSASVGRREYELAIKLPEKLKKVHEIKTDDPVGIEKYWHDRFKDKRKGGEWFELSANDVKAFKRRKKFM